MFTILRLMTIFSLFMHGLEIFDHNLSLLLI